MALEEYRKKRNFSKTSEPHPEVSEEGLQRFVIQKHQASHLHFDLRLEMEGVLKSWAIPKGPSLNPNDRRLAVRTEDHPVGYLEFEGQIPAGEYGAGKMEIWDYGTYTLTGAGKKGSGIEQLGKGKLSLEFTGNRIRGAFSLVRSGLKGPRENWLLIKGKDQYALEMEYDATKVGHLSLPSDSGPIQPGTFLAPMLASTAPEIFNDPDWLYEIKWDGYRVLAHLSDSGVFLHSRNGISYTEKFEVLTKELEVLPHTAILDGEVVILDEHGKPQFGKLQKYPEVKSGTVRYYVFDLLYLNGHGIFHLPLEQRKELLKDLIKDLEYCVYSDHFRGMGAALYEKALEEGIEGVVAKQAQSAYHSGIRSSEWLKIKKENTREAWICGYTDTTAAGRKFGSLILGAQTGKGLVYLGNCGTGFTGKESETLYDMLQPLRLEKSPFLKKPNLGGRKAKWVRPYFECEVGYSTITEKGVLRHPVYKRLRTDRTPPEAPAVPKKTQAGGNKALEWMGNNVPMTNLEKIYWPESGLRKYDLLDYYLRVADFLLPYLHDRPENLHRHPDGISKKGFYQKDLEHHPAWVKTHPVYSESTRKTSEYLLCQDLSTLLYMANLGCIEINPWNCRVSSPDRPDYCVIDIDPSKENTFDQVVEAARQVKSVLDMGGVTAFCKTSGSRGLHIYIPLGAQYTHEESRNFAKLISHYTLHFLPELVTLDRPLRMRKDKIYMDCLQNRKGQSVAAVYCVRPKPGATVSMPLPWSAIKEGLDFREFTIQTVPPLLEKADLEFKEILSGTNDLTEALTRLEAHFS